MSSGDQSQGCPMKIMVAMCDSNRGIAFASHLPWPYISKDVDYFHRMTTHLKNPEKVIVHVAGRLSWEVSTWRPNVSSVILSSAKVFKDSDHSNIVKVARSFQSAMNFINTPPFSRSVESVWIMGGQRVYEAALADSRLQYVYLTRVFGDFRADAFFPPFEKDFVRVSDPDVPEDLHEENGVRYQFELYKRK